VHSLGSTDGTTGARRGPKIDAELGSPPPRPAGGNACRARRCLANGRRARSHSLPGGAASGVGAFGAAMLANAASVAFVHNHPSGDPEPLRDDAELTRRLVRADKILGTPVLYHAVVGAGGRYASLAERGG